MSKIIAAFILLLITNDSYSQDLKSLKEPRMLISTVMITIKNINGKEIYLRKKDNYAFEGDYKILINVQDTETCSTNKIWGISTGLKSVGSFTNGYKNGFWKTLYQNKLVKTENYRTGLMIGRYRVYNSEGEILYKTTFGSEGNGIYKDYYYATGTLKEEGRYENGKKEGEWQQYDENGNPTATIIYKEGTPQ